MAVPPALKPIGHYLKLAQEHDSRDPVVAYWSRLYAVQAGLKLSSRDPEEQKFLIAIMDWLEACKKANAGNEAIMHEVVGQAHLENYAHKLFSYADKLDREGSFGKNVVKAFFTAGQVYDVLQTFGELSEESINNRKYAKWKAAYIHNCLKNGETPIAGPAAIEGESELEGIAGDSGEGASGGDGGSAEGGDDQGATEPPATPSYGFVASPGASENPEPIDPMNIRAPSPPKEPEKPPGGFKPYVAEEDKSSYQPPEVGAAGLSPEMLTKAQKYCKWAGSALNYDDVTTAIENLQKALRLLQTGQDG